MGERKQFGRKELLHPKTTCDIYVDELLGRHSLQEHVKYVTADKSPMQCLKARIPL